MPRDDDWMGQLAAQDAYDNTERDFQHAIRQTPWFSEFQQRFGEEPDLNTPDYNYRAAWAAGARPNVRDPGDNLLHWDSRYKGESHPNRFVNGVDTISGLAAPDERGFQPQTQTIGPAEMRSYTPTLGERIKGGLGDLFRSAGADPYNAGKLGDIATTGLSMFPPIGIPVAKSEMEHGVEARSPGGVVMGALGAIPGVKPGVLGDIAKPFYSAAGRAVSDAKLAKGTGEQWLGYLRNQPGVKQEELQYVFGNLPEGQLTKAQMQAHAAANEVKLGEVVKGVPPPMSEAEYRRLADLEQRRFEGTITTAEEDEFGRLMRRDVAPEGETKYRQWQLPGGENYRETLLTLPTSKADTVKFSRLRDIEDKLQNPGDYDAHELNALRLEYKQLADETRNSSGGLGSFRSPHWDEPNVLAHVRTNDREIPPQPGGRNQPLRSLHIEEIQSDWHQKGRTQGYGTEEQRRQAITEQLNTLTKEYEALPADQRGPVIDRMNALHDQMTEVRRSGTVPDAPFKSTWADVALKRQIREAAEKGYDAISWTPGEAQAARYDLSKHVKEIEYIKRGDKYELGVTDIRGEGVDMPNKAMTLKEIEDTLGKEMAEKISKGEGQKFRGHEGYSLTGLDLKVGGEGMKAFYDKMLVDKANAIGKKHGARVEQSEIAKPEMKLSYEELQRRRAGEKPDPSQFKQPVHVLRITPELRAAAMKGFPLFTAGGIVAGGTIAELARQDKYGRNE
jgi:hypothetical protein